MVPKWILWLWWIWRGSGRFSNMSASRRGKKMSWNTWRFPHDMLVSTLWPHTKTNRKNFTSGNSRVFSSLDGFFLKFITFFPVAGGSFFLNLVQLKGQGGRFKMTLPETGEFASKHKPPTIVFQASIFRCELAVGFREGYTPFATHLSNEKYPGWLGYVRDYATQLYGHLNKPL